MRAGTKKDVTIRFELPFNAWCTSCRHLMGKGVRFNADKRCVGAYHSTKIWSFSMRTPCCGGELEIHTDPAGCAYVIIKGAEQKAEAYDEREAETEALPGAAEREAARADAFSALEARTRDAGARAAAAPSLRALQAGRRRARARMNESGETAARTPSSAVESSSAPAPAAAASRSSMTSLSARPCLARCAARQPPPLRANAAAVVQTRGLHCGRAAPRRTRAPGRPTPRLH